MIPINTTEKFVRNFEQWIELNNTSSEQKVRDDFINKIQGITENYGVSNIQAACYISNYADDYICKIYNGGCKDIALCKRISNDRDSRKYWT